MPPAANAVRIVLSTLDRLVGVVGAGAIAHDLLAETEPEGSRAHV